MPDEAPVMTTTLPSNFLYTIIWLNIITTVRVRIPKSSIMARERREGGRGRTWKAS